MGATGSDRTRAAAALDALQGALPGLGLDAVLVPKADRHQGEYAPARDERLAWATGFTGSAGLAIILRDRAALFVDGRYEIQGAAQVPPGRITVFPIRETTPDAWIEAEIPRLEREGGAVIGFDPWLHTAAQVETYRKAAAKAGARLEPLAANPIDALWTDRPAAPEGAAWAHPEALAGQSAAEKRAALATALDADGLAAAILTQTDSVAWLLNIRGADLPATPVILAYAILLRDGAVRLFCDPDKIDAKLRAVLGADVTVEPWAAFDAALTGFDGEKVAVEKASAPIAVSSALEAAGATVVWRQDPTSLPKARKNAAEIGGARSAHRRDGAALARVFAWIDAEAPKGGLSEMDVVDRLNVERARVAEQTGSRYLCASFDAISGFAGNGAIVHYRVTPESNLPVRGDGLLLIDSGGQYADGTTDVTRTLAIGTPTQEQRAAVTLVLKGMIAVSRLAFPPKTRGRELDLAARAALWRHGLNYDHGTGHGVGSVLSVHEGPQSLSPRGEAMFEPGMIVSNEPGYYKRDAFGVRIENLLLVTEAETAGDPELPAGLIGGLAPERAMHRFETLTLAPIDRRLLEPGLMSPTEIAWLDAYHARVEQEIAPLLDGAESDWLKEACRPL